MDSITPSLKESTRRSLPLSLMANDSELSYASTSTFVCQGDGRAGRVVDHNNDDGWIRPCLIDDDNSRNISYQRIEGNNTCSKPTSRERLWQAKTLPDDIEAVVSTASHPMLLKRPQSAYSLFFQLERRRILDGMDEDVLGYTNRNADDTASSQRKHTYTFQAIDQFFRSKNRVNENLQKKRKHRKEHGKIGFAELARTVAKRWKQLPEDEVLLFQQYFQLQLKCYREHQKMNALPLKQLPKTMKQQDSEDSRQIHCYESATMLSEGVKVALPHQERCDYPTDELNYGWNVGMSSTADVPYLQPLAKDDSNSATRTTLMNIDSCGYPVSLLKRADDTVTQVSSPHSQSLNPIISTDRFPRVTSRQIEMNSYLNQYPSDDQNVTDYSNDIFCSEQAAHAEHFQSSGAISEQEQRKRKQIERLQNLMEMEKQINDQKMQLEKRKQLMKLRLSNQKEQHHQTKHLQRYMLPINVPGVRGGVESATRTQTESILHYDGHNQYPTHYQIQEADDNNNMGTRTTTMMMPVGNLLFGVDTQDDDDADFIRDSLVNETYQDACSLL